MAARLVLKKWLLTRMRSLYITSLGKRWGYLDRPTIVAVID